MEREIRGPATAGLLRHGDSRMAQRRELVAMSVADRVGSTSLAFVFSREEVLFHSDRAAAHSERIHP
jgi:hypothetical protein